MPNTHIINTRSRAILAHPSLRSSTHPQIKPVAKLINEFIANMSSLPRLCLSADRQMESALPSELALKTSEEYAIPPSPAQKFEYDGYMGKALSTANAMMKPFDYIVTTSPLGEIMICATPDGVVTVAFSVEDFQKVLTELTAANRFVYVDDDEDIAEILRVARGEFKEYFAGDLKKFSVPIDFALSTGFMLRARQQLCKIPYGTTASYSELAQHAGQPKAVRAAGTACSHNPIPIIVPCHRVVRADGSLGGFRVGLPAKAWLQELETNNK